MISSSDSCFIVASCAFCFFLAFFRFLFFGFSRFINAVLSFPVDIYCKYEENTEVLIEVPGQSSTSCSWFSFFMIMCIVISSINTNLNESYIYHAKVHNMA